MVDEARGDIVSEYKWLVLPFLIFNTTSWILAILEIAGVVGPAAYAAMDALYPVDISFCQMMFWGTLHYGPIKDDRLAIVCRIAFIIEAACYVVRNVVIFQPATIQDAISYANSSSVGSPKCATLHFSYLRAAFSSSCLVLRLVGTTCLQIGRRRLLSHVSAPSLSRFSTRFLRGYVVILAIQLAICAVCAWRVASATTLDEEVLATKLNYTLRAVSGICAQILGWKAVVFDASGKSIQQWRSGKGTRLQTAAVMCGTLFVMVVFFDLVLFAFATSSADSILTFHNWLEVGFENLPMMGLWLCAMVNFGISLQHFHPLRSVDKTEELLERKALGETTLSSQRTSKVSPELSALSA